MTTVVEHLTNGVRVRLASGEVITCAPLMLDKGMKLADTWDQRIVLRARLTALQAQLAQASDEVPEAERAKIQTDLIAAADDVARLRSQVARLFVEAYPGLSSKISAGDVEALVPHFFWSATGASVLVEMEPTISPAIVESTGTPSGENTSPPGATSPTPS